MCRYHAKVEIRDGSLNARVFFWGGGGEARSNHEAKLKLHAKGFEDN